MEAHIVLLCLCLVSGEVMSSEMAESESVIHSLPPPPHNLPYSPIIYPPYSYPGYSNTIVLRAPLSARELEDAIRTKDADHPKHPPVVHGSHPSILETHHIPDQLLLALHPDAALQHHLGPHHALPHHLQQYVPYQYDISKIPECAYSNKHYYNITFCLQDDYYPVDTIKHELERNKPLVDRILSDITYQSADNLVDGLTKIEEEGYNYAHYYGAGSHKSYKDDFNGYSYSPDYYKEGGYLCPSDIFYGRPKRAANTYGKWKVIVNLPDEYYAKGFGIGYEKYTQTQRLEQCMYPGAPCSYLDPHYPSACVQKHNFVRLLAYTYEEGLHIDSFKLPISCSCHLAPQHPFQAVYPHYPPYHGPTPTPIVAFGKKK